MQKQHTRNAAWRLNLQRGVLNRGQRWKTAKSCRLERVCPCQSTVRISKHICCCFKRNLMFLFVYKIFMFIPFKFHFWLFPLRIFYVNSISLNSKSINYISSKHFSQEYEIYWTSRVILLYCSGNNKKYSVKAIPNSEKRGKHHGRRKKMLQHFLWKGFLRRLW